MALTKRPKRTWTPDSERGNRHRRGYGTAWDKLRLQKLADQPLCEPCKRVGRVTAATAVDHIKPKAKGGTDDWDNLQSICESCHKAKTSRDQGHKPRREIGPDGEPLDPSDPWFQQRG